jgi:hypothetical protein
MDKLFDDEVYIDKSVTTPNDKEKWKKEFQKLCDSDEVREESNNNGLNACGYWYACDYCNDSGEKCACAKALIRYCKENKIQIDYKNINKDYLNKMLRK